MEPEKSLDKISSQEASQTRNNSRLALTVLSVAVLMLGLSFAAVPLYQMFCQVTGFGGTPQIVQENAGKKGKRILTVRFDANVSPDLDWAFKPDVASIRLRTGVTKTIFYKVTNRSDRTLTGIATYNVSPDQSGSFFNKISCFCFTEKTLKPGESMDMPVVFYLDPALETDETMKQVEGVTLSYTFVAAKAKKSAALTR